MGETETARTGFAVNIFLGGGTGVTELVSLVSQVVLISDDSRFVGCCLVGYLFTALT